MKQRKNVMRRIMDSAALQEEALPTEPVVELLGDGRVLVENHRGILEYGTETIAVRVRYGAVCIHGCNLRLGFMTCQKLIILGKIQEITLQRGVKK